MTASSAKPAGERLLAETTPAKLAPWLPGVAAARLRLGTVMPNGRPVGERDRVVHLFPIPLARVMPEHLEAFCGLRILPGQADTVLLGTGMPCIRCVAAAPSPRP
jgi:hypothetical protein